MGSIISCVEDLDHLHWTQLKKGIPAKAKRVLAVDDTQVLIELENGSYTVAGRRHTPNGNWAVLQYGLDKFQSSVLEGLVKFGVITKDQLAEHRKSTAERRARDEQRYAKDMLKKACGTLGIPVPATEGS